MSPDRPAERLVWAVETMAVKPADRLLEIGCGHGVAVSLVCEKLDGGTIIAIDRSPKMIAAASKRNADHVVAGKASFVTAALHEADLRSARFDKIFAIHVGVFLRGDPAREVEIVKRHLTPGGRLYVVDQPLERGSARTTANKQADALDRHGLEVTDVLVEDLSSATVTCVVAQAGGPIGS